MNNYSNLKSEEKRKKILFFNPIQFGYHTDTFSYCKFLDKSQFEIFYLCYDQNHPHVHTDLATIFYLPVGGSRYLRQFRMLFFLRNIIKSRQIDIIFQVHVRFALFYRLLNLRKRFILDIRTGYLSKSSFTRFLNNLSIRLASIFYKKVTIISDSLRRKLFLSSKKVLILPLGSEVRQRGILNFDKIRLLYVGTLNKRKIDLTVYGLADFLKQNHTSSISYDVIGYGSTTEEQKVKDAIIFSGLEKVINFHGLVLYEDLNRFFYNCNVGVVFLPITEAYDCQPTTKLFECLLAGIPVIATSTYENRRFVNETNGILIQDTSAAFVKGLEDLIKNTHLYNSEKIRESVKDSTWEHIVAEVLTPILSSY
jgi:glycosyltransferase involved in cell wall biosynthesis